MKNCKLIFLTIALLILVTPLILQAQKKPVALHPENPHYFSYNGKPTILITSGEHYGAVINLDFNYVAYLDELADKELNLTRTFTGAYVEPAGAFKIEQNTLAPAPQKFICPWQRSTAPGYANGGNKFDLSKWDEEYFKRLRDFVASAEKRKIVVELALFCPFYEEMQWNLSPLNVQNNINGIGTVQRTQVYTLDQHGGLLAIQEAMTRKIVQELKSFSNIIYEICNEPYFGGVTLEWQHHIASVIEDEERKLKVKHLISQNIANGAEKIADPYPGVSVFNFHYAMPPKAVAMNYHLNKVIGDNETGFNGNSDSTYRKEGWAFILAGGGLYNNLDYSFTVGHENGTFKYPSTQPGGGSTALRNQLRHLKHFMNSFDFIKMKPDTTIITSDLPKNAILKVLAEEGKQYAVYVFGGNNVKLDIKIPKGNYNLEWLNPLTGKIEKKEKVVSQDKISILSPAYKEDIALKITR